MWQNFRQFIMRGNVLDMAVGIIIGAAFGTVVSSLVNNIIMPPIGLAVGRVDFSNLFINLGPGHYDSLKAAQDAGAPTINYGLFINNVISFLIVAFAVFLLVEFVMRMQKMSKKEEEEAPAEPTTKQCPECLSEIPVGARRCAYCTTLLE